VKRLELSAGRLILFRLVLPLAAALGAQAQNGTAAFAGPHAFLARLAPREIQAGPQLGLSVSRFRASSEYGALIRPTPAEGEPRLAPVPGAVLTARWNGGISLTVAPRRERFGVRTRERTVSFPDNPFPHTLKSNTELTYNVWPVWLGMGWFAKRQHAQMQIGAYRAFLDEVEMEWIVDGEPFPNRPQVNLRQTYSGWMLGFEYGFRMGAGELTLGLETQHALDSMMEGLSGSIKAESAQVRLAYLWSLMKR
jgi:hypothetical protein